LFLAVIGIKVRRVNFIFNPGTPIFASIVNRLVEARLAIGKGRLGFIAPALYANSDVLNDVTSGTNPGCGTEGFYTARG
jgi:tripeptidyl-peptidase-1